MLLEQRNAVVYGAGGAIGGAVARAFAREGATVHLAGRTPGPLEERAAELRAGGGRAQTWIVDALDEAAVDAHADAVVAAAGSLDISFNLIGVGDIQGTPLAQMDVADFEAPIHNAARTQFLTARAAARHMIPRRCGVILTFGGYGDPVRDYSIGGFQVALATVDALRRQLAAGLGPFGTRVVTLPTGGVIESPPADFEDPDALVEGMVGPTMLGRTASFEDVGNVAAFAAPDLAASITGTAINMTCGAVPDCAHDGAASDRRTTFC